MERELELFFSKKSLRLTAPRRAVFESMRVSEHPLSAAAIARQCTNRSDRTSVYRTLHLFMQLGIAHQVPHGWKQRYELADPFKSHHHHLNCKKCGKLTDIHSPTFEEAVERIASEHGFIAEEHTFELRGLCRECSP